MSRERIYLDYIGKIDKISEFLDETSISEKSIKTYFLAFDKFFSEVLIKKFNTDYEFKVWNNETRKDVETKDLHNIIFSKFVEFNAEKKSALLEKWWKKKLEKNRNAYLNYVWRVQGLLSKLGRIHEANPKTITKLNNIEKVNGFGFKSPITFEEVLDLYEILPMKEKLIVKIMMYAGFNGADIITWKPIHFEKTEDPNYYAICRRRIKTKEKGVFYLVVFEKSFIDEIQNYFEKQIKEKTINKTPVYYDWERDKNELIFPIISQTISDNIRNAVIKNKLNLKLNPQNIRALCFTLLKDAFPLSKDYLYDAWTQHQVKKLVDKEYIRGHVDNLISILKEGKIQSNVLIGHISEMMKEVKISKNKYDVLTDEVKELKEMYKEIMKKLEK